MRTNFFEQLAGLHSKGTFLLNIQADPNGLLAVSAVIRRNDDTAADLPPMLLSGTAQELDNGFFDAIAAPVQLTAGLLNNLETYKAAVDKAGKQVKDKGKPVKAAAETEETDDEENGGDLFTAQADDKAVKAEKKRLFDEQMQKVKNLAQQMKYAEALAQLPDVQEHADKAEVIAANRQELEKGKEIYDKLQQQFND